MDTNSLLERIRSKDRDAFMQLMQTYGRGLYTRLLNQLGDKVLADAAFKETLVGFYNALVHSEGEDAVQALLYSYGDITGDRILESSLAQVINETVSETQLTPEPEPESPLARQAGVPEPEENEEAADEKQEAAPGKEENRAGWWLGLAVGGLSVAILAALWVIAGLLMDMGLLPELDLGFEWFSANVAPWF